METKNSPWIITIIEKKLEGRSEKKDPKHRS